jgi:hypothetical protein
LSAPAKRKNLVANCLGHADSSFTLRTYVHLMDEGIGDAEFMDKAIGGARPLLRIDRLAQRA